MNVNLDGTPVSFEQHMAIAAAAGLDVETLRHQCGELHSAAASMSIVSFANRAERFAMWARGELNLDTRPILGPATPGKADAVLDTEVAEFLVATMTTAPKEAAA